jgi:TPR repeat protein
MKLKTLLLSLLLSTSLIGTTYADYNDGVKVYQAKDYATALKELEPLAEQGYAIAQFALGSMYDFGEGVERDDKQAVKWYKKAAEQGFDEAQNRLGSMYRDGEGVERDDKQAVKWYKKAAEQGYAIAQINLGLMYITQDMTKAKYWIQKASKGDDVQASKLAERFWNTLELWKY